MTSNVFLAVQVLVSFPLQYFSWNVTENICCFCIDCLDKTNYTVDVYGKKEGKFDMKG